MDKFVVRKRKLKEDEDQIVTPTACPDSTSNIESVTGPSGSKCGKVKQALLKKRTYFDAYLAHGFASNNDEDNPRPVCVVCGETLSNEAMVPSKLKRHLTTKHPGVAQKGLPYFSRLLERQNMAASKMVKRVTIADTALEASFKVAELIAKKMKPHTTGEEIIIPACNMIVETMLGKEARHQISKVPLSNNTISRRISEMSADINDQVVQRIVSNAKFALQVDESTDIAGKCQLLGFCRFINEGVVEQFMFCKELQTTTTGEDIFATVTSYFTDHGLSWKDCCSICTDGAPSMIGKYKGFITKALKENPSMITTHCFLHREALVAKTCSEELTEVLNQAVKIVNFIKSRPLKCRVFQKICQEMGAAHISLMLHTDVRWLSRGRVLNRVLELKDELEVFFEEEKQDAFLKMLQNHSWCLKLSYLADIFMKLNELNLSMQGRLETIVASSNKMKGFQRKLGSWKSAVQKDDLSNFPSLLHQAGNNDLGALKDLILNHLLRLREAVDFYFPSLSTENLDWIVSPFELADRAEELDFTAIERDKFIDMCADSTLKVKFEKSEVSLGVFWRGLVEEYPNLAEKATYLLLPFSTSYLCEQAFSAMATIKSKSRNRLLSLEDDMRVALSAIRPDIKSLCSKHQSQVSH